MPTPSKPAKSARRTLKPNKRVILPDEASKSFQHRESERIAKYLARAGIASRREIERLIEAGEVSVNGAVLETPAFKVTGRERILVRGKMVDTPDVTRAWLYHKPSGLITTQNDPEGRPTVFKNLPKGMPRVVSVGRLDLTTEGLMILTNNGGLSREMELPKNALSRHYRARVFGDITQEQLDSLEEGIVLDKIVYKPIKAVLEREAKNSWISLTLHEGKNREVRRVLEAFELQVSRLIRTQYGPFELGELKPGHVEEIRLGDYPDIAGLIDEPVADRPLPLKVERPGKPERKRTHKPFHQPIGHDGAPNPHKNNAKSKSHKSYNKPRHDNGDKPRGKFDDKPRNLQSGRSESKSWSKTAKYEKARGGSKRSKSRDPKR